jgi:hypothetical protein
MFDYFLTPDSFYFADDGQDVDGLPTEGVEITFFNLVM